MHFSWTYSCVHYIFYLLSCCFNFFLILSLMKLFIYGYLPSSIHHSYSENNNSTYLNIFTTIFVKSKQYLQADIIKFQKQSISDTLILFHKFNYYYLYHRIYRVPYSIIFLTIDHRIICYFFICFYFVVITCFICLCLCLGWDNL